MKKIIIFIIAFSLVFLAGNVQINAAYNYGPDSVVTSAEALVSNQVVDNSNLTDVTGKLANYQLGELVDVAVFENKVYLVDNSNNKIVILDEQYNYLTSFPADDAEDKEKLNRPRGIYVTADGIYVCDFSNQRVAIYDHQYQLIQEILTPEDYVFEGYEFRPKKVAVNRTGRIFVVAEGINEGIIDFNPDGTFSRYYGMNSVTVSAWDAFWLMFTSEEQRASQGYNFGAALVNLCIDQDEYVYTVSSSDASNLFIKKLNYKGSDVLVRNGYVPPMGDASIVEESPFNVPEGFSTFVDIDVNEYGTYIALDKIRGRIFAYDFEGNLLYVGGQLATAIGGTSSSQTSMFQAPEALCFFNDKILAVDSKNRNLLVFGYTTYGNLVNEATKLYYENKAEEAAVIWEQVLQINTNCYLAYSGIGKAQLRQGKYEEAMTNLKLGYDQYNYSRAYQQYRYEKMSAIFPYILGVVLVGCVALLAKSVYSSIKRSQREEEGLE